MEVVSISQTTWIAASAVATFLLALATVAFVYTAFKQLPILRQGQAEASRSADAATRAADAAEASLASSREIARQQSIATTFPVLDISIAQRDGSPEIEVANRGEAPALDVDLLIFLEYTEAEIPLHEFVRHEVAVEWRHQLLEKRLNQDDIWSLRDRLTYAGVPARRRVVARISTPIACSTLHVLSQYRDVLGHNYCRLDLFFVSEDGARFHLAAGSTSHVEHCPRLSIDLEVERGDPGHLGVPAGLQADIQRNAGPMKLHVVPLGMLKGRNLDVEDRGTWGDA